MEQLIIFVKAPRLGTVKKRLARTLGPEAACAAYCQIVELLLERLAASRAVELRFTPDDAALEIQPWLRPGWRPQPQGPGDLGARMHHAFVSAFQAGAERAVIIGSDCPAVTLTDIADAFAALKQNDLVLGPAVDGGYWLIGLSQPQSELFHAIAWSTAAVLDQTLERARQTTLQTALLRTLPDVDTVQDWDHFRASQTSIARSPF